MKRPHLQRRAKVAETDSEVEEIVPVKQVVEEAVPQEEEESEELESDEEEALEKPKFSKKLVDIEVIEGSAARLEVIVDDSTPHNPHEEVHDDHH